MIFLFFLLFLWWYTYAPPERVEYLTESVKLAASPVNTTLALAHISKSSMQERTELSDIMQACQLISATI